MNSKRKLNNDSENTGAQAASEPFPFIDDSFEDVDHSFFNVVNEENYDSSDSDGDFAEADQENEEGDEYGDILQSSEEEEEEVDESEEEQDEVSDSEDDSDDGSSNDDDDAENDNGNTSESDCENGSERNSDSDVLKQKKTEKVTETASADSGIGNGSKTQNSSKTNGKLKQLSVKSKQLTAKPKTSDGKSKQLPNKSQTIDEYADHDTSDEEDIRNTVGNIPLNWYDEYKHLGYDWDGKQIVKPPKKDSIDEFLRRIEDPDFWRTVKDPQTGQDVVLSQEDLEIIRRIGKQKIPDAQFDDYAVSFWGV